MDITGGTITPGESLRDRGLVRGVGLAAFTATIVNGVVGAGVFTLPAVMALNMGPRAPLAFLVCAVAMGAVVLCAADAGRRVPTSGGIYGTVTAGLGPRAGFVAGFVGIWVSSVLSCGGIAAAFADGVGSAVPALAAGIPRALLILAVIGGLMLVNLRGVGFAARFLTVATLVKLVPLALFVGIGAWFVTATNLHAGAASGGGDGFGRAVIFALFAFSGMETPLAASGEAADPRRTVPRAIILSMVFVLALYVAVQVVAQGLLGSGLAGTKDAPLAAAIATVSPVLGIVLAAGATLSRLIWIGSDILGAPRVLFAFARDRLLPAVLGRVDPRFHVPRVAIVIHSVLVAILAISGTFEALAILSGLASTLLYSLSCAAAWRLDARRAGGDHAGAWRRGIVPAAALVGIVAMIAIAVQAKPEELAGMGASVAIALAIYAGRRVFAAAA